MKIVSNSEVYWDSGIIKIMCFSIVLLVIFLLERLMD